MALIRSASGSGGGGGGGSAMVAECWLLTAGIASGQSLTYQTQKRAKIIYVYLNGNRFWSNVNTDGTISETDLYLISSSAGMNPTVVPNAIAIRNNEFDISQIGRNNAWQFRIFAIEE